MARRVTQTLRIRRESTNVQFGQTLNSVRIEAGLPEAGEIKEELLHYANVLLGREPCPIESPYLAMQEVATAYHSRAREIEMMIYELEAEGVIMRGSPLYKLRTGSLRSFIDLAKRCAELGSRRMSQESLLMQQRLDGGPR